MDQMDDYRARAAEADSRAETARESSMAQGWRDIANGYRRLAQDAAAARSKRGTEEARRAEGIFGAVADFVGKSVDLTDWPPG